MFTLDRGGVCEEVNPHTAITTIAQVSCATNSMHYCPCIRLQYPRVPSCVLT